MVNANKLGIKFQESLPKDEVPEKRKVLIMDIVNKMNKELGQERLVADMHDQYYIQCG